jgi:hypothetical protein
VKAAAIALCAVLLAAVAYLVGDHRGATRQDLVCQVAHDAEEAQRERCQPCPPAGAGRSTGDPT